MSQMNLEQRIVTSWW